jgi:DNA-binding NtrC family response regulator
VQAHEGAVFVYSQPGQGTKFQLYFPAFVATDADKIPAAPSAVPRGNGQRVLYVEDEGPLGNMGRKLLERLNYVVDVHNNPGAALATFRDSPHAYELVVTDLTMPRMTGLELGREIMKIRPGLPMILMTGYAGTLDPEQARAGGFCELLLKPLSMETLGTAVDRALRRTSVAR